MMQTHYVDSQEKTTANHYDIDINITFIEPKPLSYIFYSKQKLFDIDYVFISISLLCT